MSFLRHPAFVRTESIAHCWHPPYRRSPSLSSSRRCFVFWAFYLCWCSYGCQFLGLFVMFCLEYTLVW